MQPSPINEAVRERRSIVRTRTYSVHAYEVDSVFAELKSQKFTGKLVVDFNQGGVNQITVEDKQALPYLTAHNSSV